MAYVFSSAKKLSDKYYVHLKFSCIGSFNLSYFCLYQYAAKTCGLNYEKRPAYKQAVFAGGDWRTRTADLLRVKQAL